MKITRSRKHHVSLGNYEYLEFEASIEVETTTDPKAAAAHLDEQLTVLLAAEVQEAREVTAEKKSYIHLYKENI